MKTKQADDLKAKFVKKSIPQGITSNLEIMEHLEWMYLILAGECLVRSRDESERIERLQQASKRDEGEQEKETQVFCEFCETTMNASECLQICGTCVFKMRQPEIVKKLARQELIHELEMEVGGLTTFQSSIFGTYINAYGDKISPDYVKAIMAVVNILNSFKDITSPQNNE